MFDRMDLGSVHNRLKVRTGHTDIEGRNMAVSGNVPSGNINTGNQFQMIDSEACDLFHNQIHPFVSFAVCCCTQVGIFRKFCTIQRQMPSDCIDFYYKGDTVWLQDEICKLSVPVQQFCPFNCQFILVSLSDLYYNNG